MKAEVGDTVLVKIDDEESTTVLGRVAEHLYDDGDMYRIFPIIYSHGDVKMHTDTGGFFANDFEVRHIIRRPKKVTFYEQSDGQWSVVHFGPLAYLNKEEDIEPLKEFLENCGCICTLVRRC